MTTAVSFRGVTKSFTRGGFAAGNMRDTLTYIGHRITRRPSDRAARRFLALDDVSFDVECGESFAILGANGAGKTTALKLMTRVTAPSAGELRVRGRVGALIEVGAGVHPDLTGRENIWLYGQLLGMSREELRRRFDDIVEFSELQEVLDTPTKRYSSGMQLRLGFAIAAHVDPEIFVVDEALSVGDAVFQARCIERMNRFVQEGRTLIFVSHNLPEIESLCSRAIFLQNGHVVGSGDARSVLASYIDWVETQKLSVLARGEDSEQRHGGVIDILDVSLRGADGVERRSFRPRDAVEIRVRMRGPRVERPHLNLSITDGRPGTLVTLSMLVDGQAPDAVGPGEWTATCRIAELRLLPRLYEVWGNVCGADGASTLTEWQRLASFRVDDGIGAGPRGLTGRRLAGGLDVDYEWVIEDAQPTRVAGLVAWEGR